MYLHRYPKIFVHVLQTSLIIRGGGRICVIYTVFQSSQSEAHRGSVFSFGPASFLLFDLAGSILTAAHRLI